MIVFVEYKPNTWKAWWVPRSVPVLHPRHPSLQDHMLPTHSSHTPVTQWQFLCVLSSGPKPWGPRGVGGTPPTVTGIKNIFKCTTNFSGENANCGWNLFKIRTNKWTQCVSLPLYHPVQPVCCVTLLGAIWEADLSRITLGEMATLWTYQCPDSPLLDSNVWIQTDQAVIMESWRNVTA